jgi:asparagine synthase (glutamine-hydrolysing)
MCGIFAAINKNINQIDFTQIEKIKKLLNHRGPDANGIWQNEHVLLMHTRLKIIDLTDSANQPFLDEAGDISLIFNGEIYNFLTLKSELEKAGYKFKTRSDTEVILYAYKHWGESFINKLVGMFAIVVHDAKNMTTHIYRDRIGIKPLYITRVHDTYYVSSEIKPLLLFNKALVNENALWSYFNLRYVAGNSTMFFAIDEVSPGGHYEIKNGCELIKSKYWDLRDIKPIYEAKQIRKLELYELTEEVVSNHFVTDAKMGSFLSGGIDSAYIASVFNKRHLKPQTFTYATGLEEDELLKAQKISYDYAFENYAVRNDDKDFSLYRDAIKSLEDPIGDSIILPTLLLARAASKTNKVVLSGEGADEIFSGYIHHQFLTLEDKVIRRLPKFMINFGRQVISLIPYHLAEFIFPYPAKLGRGGWEKIIWHLNNLEPSLNRYVGLVGLFNDNYSRSIFSGELKFPSEIESYWTGLEEFEFPDRLKRFDLYYWARNYTLHRLDKLTMACSLEARVPYFDHRLIEYILKIKSNTLYSVKDPKRKFREAVAHSDLPQNVVSRKKQAFYFPVEKVFSQKQIKNAKEIILDNADKRSIYIKKNLEKLLGKKNMELLDAKQFIVLLNFELWCQEFID